MTLLAGWCSPCVHTLISMLKPHQNVLGLTLILLNTSDRIWALFPGLVWSWSRRLVEFKTDRMRCLSKSQDIWLCRATKVWEFNQLKILSVGGITRYHTCYPDGNIQRLQFFCYKHFSSICPRYLRVPKYHSKYEAGFELGPKPAADPSRTIICEGLSKCPTLIYLDLHNLENGKFTIKETERSPTKRIYNPVNSRCCIKPAGGGFQEEEEAIIWIEWWQHGSKNNQVFDKFRRKCISRPSVPWQRGSETASEPTDPWFESH